MMDHLDLRIAKLELQPGDILLLKTSVKLAPRHLEQMNTIIREMVPPNVKTLLLDGADWQVAVLRAESDAG
jgi:hypothetical protein